MWAAFSLALSDVFTPAGRRALLLTLGGTVALLVVLWIGASALLMLIHASPFRGVDITINVLGSLATLLAAWLLFPSLSILVLGIFLDPFVTAIEHERYPHLPPARRVGAGELMRSAWRLTILALMINLVLLPIYFIPVVNLPVYYGLNGDLVDRTYFESVALLRMPLHDARKMWRMNRGYLSIAGAIVAFLLSVPIVGFLAPMAGLSFILHLFEKLLGRAQGQIEA